MSQVRLTCFNRQIGLSFCADRTFMSLTFIRARIFAKNLLKRDSIPFLAVRAVYRRARNTWGKVFPHQQREITDNSIFLYESEMEGCSLFPKEILNATIELFHPKSVLDVGCGTGVSMEYFQKHGAEVYGLEGSEMAKRHSRVGEKIQIVDLHKPVKLDRKFDVVWSFEVAEHIHPDYVDSLLTTLTSNGDLLVLSAAQPGQGGLGHLNEQPREYWIDRIEKRGFIYMHDVSAKYFDLPDSFAKNMMVYKRRTGAAS